MSKEIIALISARTQPRNEISNNVHLVVAFLVQDITISFHPRTMLLLRKRIDVISGKEKYLIILTYSPDLSVSSTFMNWGIRTNKLN